MHGRAFLRKKLKRGKVHREELGSHTASWVTGLPWCSDGKESACDAGDMGSILGSRRCPGEGNGNPHQYPCPDNSMERGA